MQPFSSYEGATQKAKAQPTSPIWASFENSFMSWTINFNTKFLLNLLSLVKGPHIHILSPK